MRFEYLFFAVVGIVVLNLLFQVVKNKGLRGAVFGAPVARTIGEMDLGRQGIVRRKLKVHTFTASGAAAPEVGIEIVTSTIGSWNMAPIPLSRSEALTLSGLLSQAAGEVIDSR